MEFNGVSCLLWILAYLGGVCPSRIQLTAAAVFQLESTHHARASGSLCDEIAILMEK
jgi:hypothetical protein